MDVKILRNFSLATVLLFALTAVASAASTIKIGGLFAVTGPAAFLGEPERNTAQMVVDQINAAGGILDSQVLQRAHALRIDPAHFLKEHNSYPCLVQIGGLLKTGATQTNVMDLRVALVE